MNAATFDSLGFSRRLQQIGFSREQAEGFADLQRELIEDRLATKQDLRETESRIKADIIKWVAGMLVAQTALLAALAKLT
jgi:hypothetical protein